MGHVRLVMAGEHRPTAPDVRPLGEARPPPVVVLRHAVELRQVHGDRPHRRRVRRQGPGRGRGPVDRMRIPAEEIRDAGRRFGRGCVLGDGEVHERIDVRSERLRERRHVGRQGHLRTRLAPLPPAGVQKVRQRLGPGGGGVRMPRQVPGGIEERMGPTALLPAMDEVMGQGLDAGGGDVGMRGQICTDVEERMRAASLPPAMGEIVRQRLGSGGRDVGVLPQIPADIEDGVRTAAFTPAVLDVMEQRIDVRGADVGVAAAIPGRVEELPWRSPQPPAAALVIRPRWASERPAAATVACRVPGRVEVGLEIGGGLRQHPCELRSSRREPREPCPGTTRWVVPDGAGSRQGRLAR